MKILITGGCGFLGHHLVEHFLKTTDHQIVVLDKMTYASSGLDRLRDVSIPAGFGDGNTASMSALACVDRLTVLGCDLSQPIPDGVDREIGEIDYVIHAAAESHVDRSIKDPMPFIQSNVVGTHHLLWWARSRSIRRVFCVSTDEVYGPATWDEPGHDETQMFRPANPYAAAKAGGECLAMAYSNTYKLPVTIITTMNLIGERQHWEKYVPLVIRKTLRGETLAIHADPSKTRSGTRFYIHCRNFASALAFLIERDGYRGPALHGSDNDGRFEIPSTRLIMPIKLHVAGEREISNLDLAQMIAGFVGKPLSYELVNWHESRPGHDLRYALDGSYVRAMGWQQPLDIERSLEKTVKWFLANPRWLGL